MAFVHCRSTHTLTQQNLHEVPTHTLTQQNLHEVQTNLEKAKETGSRCAPPRTRHALDETSSLHSTRERERATSEREFAAAEVRQVLIKPGKAKGEARLR